MIFYYPEPSRERPEERYMQRYEPVMNQCSFALLCCASGTCLVFLVVALVAVG
jgi:hypothetical protein